MTEPTTTLTAAAWAAALSGITLAVFGLDYYALLAAWVGALMALGQTEKMPIFRAISYVALSTFVGAAFGSAAVQWLDVSSRAPLMLLSIVAGAGANAITTAGIEAVISRIKILGGKKDA